jgi:transcriptional antiterminator
VKIGWEGIFERDLFFNREATMTGMKFYERYKLLIELIEKRKTGSPKELALKLGIKERMVYNVIDDLRLTLEIGICFSTEENSYIFSDEND